MPSVFYIFGIVLEIADPQKLILTGGLKILIPLRIHDLTNILDTATANDRRIISIKSEAALLQAREIPKGRSLSKIRKRNIFNDFRFDFI